jgi:L-lactate dehydrogenase complex protein LldG
MADAAESGDRRAFLDRARAARGGPPPNAAHPMPDVATAPVPVVRPRVDAGDLVAAFAAAARAADATVDLVPSADVPADLVAAIVAEYGVAIAVATDEAAAVDTAAALRTAGVRVDPATIDAAKLADLGVTGCVAAVASTGSVVLDNAQAGSRVVGLLPRVHLCIVHASHIVATPSDVLRTRPRRPEGLPSNLVLVTGPSRTGDIEQILTLGVHGPTALRIVVLAAPS